MPEGMGKEQTFAAALAAYAEANAAGDAGTSAYDALEPDHGVYDGVAGEAGAAAGDGAIGQPYGQQVLKGGAGRPAHPVYEEIADYEAPGVPYRAETSTESVPAEAPDKPVEQWTVEEVAAWIGGALKLEAAAAAFRAEAIDGAVLLQVDDEVLRDDLGVTSKLGRIKLLTARDRLPELRAAEGGAGGGPTAGPGLPQAAPADLDKALPAPPEMPYSSTEGRNYVTVARDKAVPFAPDGDGYDMPEPGRM